MNFETEQLLKQSGTFFSEMSHPSKFVSKGQARGVWQALIILIDFPDYRWNHRSDGNFFNDDTLYTKRHYENMLFSLDSFRNPYSQNEYTGSMRDFYLENSYGQFDLTGVVTLWYTASQPLSYYADDRSGFGSYPRSSGRLVEEAVILADPNVDFSQFDNNGDSRVDALFVVHAGPGAEEIYTVNFPEHTNYLWSHKSSISSVVKDGVTVAGYTLEPENGAIGVFCHEFGHALGLPDLYDTDNSSEGIGEWGLMAAGGWCHRTGDLIGTSPAHFTAWSKEALGWLQPVNITQNNLQKEIPPVETHPAVYRLWTDGQAGGEYFLIENRQNIGFDAGLTRRQKDFHLPDAHGLIIYHVDHSGSQFNELRRVIDVEEASPFFDNENPIEQLDLQRILPTHEFLINGNRGDNGDPFPGFSGVNSAFNDYTGERDRMDFDENSVPNSHDNDGLPTSVAVANIREVGVAIVADLFVSQATSVVHPDVSVPSEFDMLQNYPNPFNPETEIRFLIPASQPGGIRVQLSIYNLKGERVKSLLAENKLPGAYSAVWDGTDDLGGRVSSGLYFYRFRSKLFTKTRRMLLLK
ncbi:MAG: M6 family metalloprotease domain-containing protein [bacterium]